MCSGQKSPYVSPALAFCLLSASHPAIEQTQPLACSSAGSGPCENATVGLRGLAPVPMMLPFITRAWLSTTYNRLTIAHEKRAFIFSGPQLPVSYMQLK